MVKIFKNKGFSLVELLIIIAIMFLITLVFMPSLIDFQRKQSLKNTTENVISLLNKAKSDSLSSLNLNNYGVHFEDNYMVYFSGNIFSESGSDNKTINFESGTSIPSGGINLNGGADEVIFPRLTGDITGYGIIIIQLTAKPDIQKIITISKTGAISSN